MLSDLAFSLSEELEADLTVIASRQRYDDPTAVLANSDEINRVKITRVWTSRFGRGNLLGRAMDYITFYATVFIVLLFKSKRDDIIVAKTDPPMISVICAFCSRLKGFTLVTWSQDLFPEIGKALKVNLLFDSLYKPMLRMRNWSLSSAKHNVVIGENMSLKLSDYRIPASSLQIIHNWAKDIAPIDKSRNKLRSDWGFGDEFVVGYSGNLGRGHDVDTIIATINQLRNTPKVKFLFVGGGAKIDELQRRLISLDNVCFKPYQARKLLSESLSVPDVHLISLLPELEGYMVPSKFYGVIAAGRPVIFVGDTNGEISKLVRQHNCGAVVEKDDSDALSERILYMSKHEELVSNMGRNGHAAFIMHYQLDKVIPKWKKILS